jgi:hypothetical protein
MSTETNMQTDFSYDRKRISLQAQAMAIVNEQRMKRITVVETPERGVVRYYDATAEFYDPRKDELAIVSTTHPDEDLALFRPGDWRRVTVLDGFKQVLFSITRGGDAIKVVELASPEQWPAA